MKNLVIALVLFAVASTGMVACQNDAQTGALIGAAAGAGLGAAIDNDKAHRGALIGAGIGAGTGYIIGNESDKTKQRERYETYRRYDY